MAKKKSTQENATPIIVDEDEIATPEEETFKDLNEKLAKIRKNKGVIGYILRNTTSATIDLTEPEKIVEYAIFSSQVMDSSQEISDLLETGDVQNVLIDENRRKQNQHIHGKRRRRHRHPKTNFTLTVPKFFLIIPNRLITKQRLFEAATS
jgi:hypothetical protein